MLVDSVAQNAELVLVGEVLFVVRGRHNGVGDVDNTDDTPVLTETTMKVKHKTLITQ